MPDTTQTSIYLADTRTQAVFAADGPHPNFFVDLPNFKALVVGLEAGGQIPLHPGEPAIYHFLEGSGLMTVEDETFAVHPGVTIYAPAGARRGMNARTRLVFLGAKGA
jgi:quercetin dioxygenase-like cupin family protein